MAYRTPGGLRFLVGLGRLGSDRLARRVDRVGGGAYAGDHNLRQVTLAGDIFQVLADFDLHPGDFGALGVLVFLDGKFVRYLQKLLVKRHKFFGRPIALHPDLLVKLLKQLGQRSHHVSLFVDRLGLLLAKDRTPRVFRRADAYIGQPNALFAGPYKCDNRSQPFGDLSLICNPLVSVFVAELLRADRL